ncbi:hypothetical protein [Psychrobacter immobilis]|uniref:hypothetical protein n=1 Tax=Psychrobacter immobilis TaxID=498 RepID=UPI001918C4C4|nr:hypothetical protein [Psychrobacter immobilis]
MQHICGLLLIFDSVYNSDSFTFWCQRRLLLVLILKWRAYHYPLFIPTATVVHARNLRHGLSIII